MTLRSWSSHHKYGILLSHTLLKNLKNQEPIRIVQSARFSLLLWWAIFFWCVVFVVVVVGLTYAAYQTSIGMLCYAMGHINFLSVQAIHKCWFIAISGRKHKNDAVNSFVFFLDIAQFWYHTKSKWKIHFSSFVFTSSSDLILTFMKGKNKINLTSFVLWATWNSKVRVNGIAEFVNCNRVLNHLLDICI